MKKKTTKSSLTAQEKQRLASILEDENNHDIARKLNLYDNSEFVKKLNQRRNTNRKINHKPKHVSKSAKCDDCNMTVPLVILCLILVFIISQMLNLI